jgi:DNA-binding transcriptional MerR regulator
MAGFVAAVGWLVAGSNGCEAALVQDSSSATAAKMVEEQRSLQVALASITHVEQAGRTNLRPAALNKGTKDHDGMEGGEKEDVMQRVMRREAMDGGDARAGKPLGGSYMQSKRMTKERMVDWAKQLGISHKDVNQLVKSYNAKEANLATRARFLSKHHTDEADKFEEGQRKLVQQYSKAFKLTSPSSSSTQSFFDAMLNTDPPLSSSNRTALSTSNISHSHQRDLRRKMDESELNDKPELNDSCSDSNPTFLVGGAMVNGSLEGAQNYTAESCAFTFGGDVGLWCK